MVTGAILLESPWSLVLFHWSLRGYWWSLGDYENILVCLGILCGE